jgi:hypothetical protein
VAAAAKNARAVAVYELNSGQMLDDIRLAVRNVPVHFIGGLSFDEASFGVAPALTARNLAERIRAALAESRKEAA